MLINESQKDKNVELSEADCGHNAIWLSVSEAAKIGGIQTKTIRRAIQSRNLKYKIVKNRYLIEFASMIFYLHTKTKLKNKLNNLGIGQFIEKWK